MFGKVLFISTFINFFSFQKMLFYVSLAIGSFILWQFWKRRQASKGDLPLHRENWKKDTVYLVQFPNAPYVRTISPYSLKLETWLRLNKIPYEDVYSGKFSKKGTIPYIELNGEHIPDSNVIIQRLKV